MLQPERGAIACPVSRLALLVCAGAFSMAGLSGAASAEDFAPKAGDIGLRLGAAWVGFDGDSDVTVGGMDQPDGGIDIDDNLTVSGEVEYFLTPNIGVSLTLGIPPETTVEGTGTLAPYDELGDIRYGLGALMAKYHYTGWGRFQPFAGAGVAYFHVFDTEDASISGLEVDNAVGPVIQIGADVMITRRIGAFASVSHAFMDTEGEGTVLVPTGVTVPPVIEAPAEADITLDPTVIQAGLVVRF